MKRGLIALDIDGTLTGSQHLIPLEVITYLHALYDDGWCVVLLTGRMLSFAQRAIQDINFPYYLAVQNGADILEMPHKKLATRAYFGLDIVEKLDHLYQNLPSDFLIYSGYESGDFCYYRSKKYPASMTSYLEKLASLSDAPWQDCPDFSLEQKSFPLIKCVGFYDDLKKIEEKLTGVTTALISDPISDGYYHLILVTHADATKGRALRRIQSYLEVQGPVIAAGDDVNDVPMFKEADVAIVMETAPKDVLNYADIIAKPSTELGIIPALKTAISKC